jgi:hypothetical protein
MPLHTNIRPVNVEIQDKKAHTPPMAAIFSIAPGGEQCYYAAAKHKLGKFLFP